jgi:hypothetical protein
LIQNFKRIDPGSGDEDESFAFLDQIPFLRIASKRFKKMKSPHNGK